MEAMKREQRDAHRHKIIKGVYVCSNCGRYRVTKEVALPLTLPDELPDENCPLCGRDQKFMKIG
jgi:rubrerythrin